MLDIEFMRECTPLFYKAISLTLYISFFGICFSLLIGFIFAWILFLKVRFLSSIVSFYVELARNTPLLIQLFFLYYGLHNITHIQLSPYTCAIVGLSFLGGGYMCESFRSSLCAIAPSQIQAAQSIGLKSYQIMYYVLLPQGLAIAMPSICANVLFLLKETSVVGVIALADIMFVAKDIITTYHKTNEALAMLVCCYLVILLPLSILFSLLEHFYKKRVL
ncbi:amino acid ABC transporter permease [Helicobacter marmotae]|uniref:Amino acid ABC transporter permease n=1 Tax=Helicobacter marmotae TaxID=152490 RepID=A0A3D8I4U9_9HELI|nr:amino acid ABC transporter permease [Helicobacter marmotae]RDU60183.1 amino acid ABC transporter permease [Helicobacter marmotae]